jgi:hypothetical protein
MKRDAANAKLAAAIESAARRGESRVAAHMADALMRRLAKASGMSLDEYREWLRAQLKPPAPVNEAYSEWLASRVQQVTQS